MFRKANFRFELIFFIAFLSKLVVVIFALILIGPHNS